jgi:hypothetical protein
MSLSAFFLPAGCSWREKNEHYLSFKVVPPASGKSTLNAFVEILVLVYHMMDHSESDSCSVLSSHGFSHGHDGQ